MNQPVYASAIRSEVSEGLIYTLPAPARHAHVIAHAAALGEPTPVRGEQGFVGPDGAFLSRKQAFLLATRAGQIKPRQPGQYNGPELFSEDVW